MKPNFTVREKVLLAILGVLILFCAYYYVFLIPVTKQLNQYTEATYMTEDQILLAEAKVAKMKMIYSGGSSMVFRSALKAEVESIWTSSMM